MTDEWRFEYAGGPEFPEPAPPFIEVDIESPNGLLFYICLLDSGANRFAFPQAAAADFGVEDLLGPVIELDTAGGSRRGRALQDAGALAVRLDAGTLMPIIPTFLDEEDPETGERYPDIEPILGRDLFLSFSEVAFNQLKQLVILRR